MRPEKQARQVRAGEWSTRVQIAIKRAVVTLTSQLVVVHVDLFECSQLTELGWDAT